MKFSVITLGCKVNAYESESYIESMIEAGFEYVNPKEKADIYIVNSCAVTNAAALKTRQQISRSHRINEKAMIVVVGCYAQVESELLMENEMISLLVGSNKKGQLVPLIKQVLAGEDVSGVDANERNFDYEDLGVTSFSNNQRAFLKVQDGCDQFCSFCIIPFARGKERSLPLDKVLDHAHYFVNEGHKEIVLSGIHTGRYGEGIDTDLYTLMKTLLNEEERLERLRVSSIEILEINEDIVKLAKDNKRLANHWHIPLQAGCDKTLKSMNRRYTTEEYAERIQYLKNELNNVAISADVIVGFPGESERDFEETMKFIESLELAFLHVFPYSPKNNTRASFMKDQVPGDVKKARVRKLLQLSETLKENYMNKFVGKVVEVLVESENDHTYKGYSSEYFEVRFESDEDLRNKIINVYIDGVKGDYAYGTKI